jgi:hypothetical protein
MPAPHRLTLRFKTAVKKRHRQRPQALASFGLAGLGKGKTIHRYLEQGLESHSVVRRTRPGQPDLVAASASEPLVDRGPCPCVGLENGADSVPAQRGDHRDTVGDAQREAVAATSPSLPPAGDQALAEAPPPRCPPAGRYDGSVRAASGPDERIEIAPEPRPRASGPATHAKHATSRPRSVPGQRNRSRSVRTPVPPRAEPSGVSALTWPQSFVATKFWVGVSTTSIRYPGNRRGGSFRPHAIPRPGYISTPGWSSFCCLQRPSAT